MKVKQPFELVVADHGPAVLRVCRAVLGPVDADDAWSETFLSAERDGILDIAYRTVLDHLPEIGYGHTASYVAVARLAGHPKAFRAVGSACATNPLPVIVPCHRLVRADGGMGGYLGGAEAKRTLLTLEAAATPSDGPPRLAG